MLIACRGLLWEEWRRTRKLALGVLAVMIAGTRALFLLNPRLEDVQLWLSVGCLYTLILYLPVSHSTANDIQAGIPTRRYLLPVSTFSLVFWPLLYRLALVVALTSVSALLSVWLFHSTRPQWALICYLVAATALIHMLAWSARLAGKWLTTFGAFFLFFLLRWAADKSKALFLPSPWAELMVASAATLATLSVTTLVLRVLRSGGLGIARSVRTRAAVKGSLAAHSSRITTEPFRSTFRAQVWFEWRSGAARMTLILCCPVCMFLLLPGVGQVQAPIAVLAPGWGLVAMLAVPAGLWTFAKNNATARRSPARFEHTRPEDDAILAWARLASAGATVAVCYVVITGFGLACYFVFTKLGLGFVNDLQPESGAPPQSLLYAIAFAGLAGTWIAYTRGATVGLFGLILVCEGELGPEVLPNLHAWLWSTPQPMPWGLQFILIISTLLLLRPFLVALRCGVLSRRAIATLVVVWVLGTVIMSRSLSSAVLSEFSLTPGYTFVLWACAAVVILLALSPFATVPLQVERSRHR